MSIKLIAIFAVCLVVLLVPFVRGDSTTESFSVYTDQQSYQVGQTVNVYVQANSINPGQNITIIDVVVYDPNNSTAAEWTNPIILTNTTTPESVGSLNATIAGTYTVNASATGCAYKLYCTWHFFCEQKPPKAIPEYSLGTIAAMTAIFGATSLYITRKKYATKK